jgi:hypothetical protein
VNYLFVLEVAVTGLLYGLALNRNQPADPWVSYPDLGREPADFPLECSGFTTKQTKLFCSDGL